MLGHLFSWQVTGRKALWADRTSILFGAIKPCLLSEEQRVWARGSTSPPCIMTRKSIWACALCFRDGLKPQLCSGWGRVKTSLHQEALRYIRQKHICSANRQWAPWVVRRVFLPSSLSVRFCLFVWHISASLPLSITGNVMLRDCWKVWWEGSCYCSVNTSKDNKVL